MFLLLHLYYYCESECVSVFFQFNWINFNLINLNSLTFLKFDLIN